MLHYICFQLISFIMSYSSELGDVHKTIMDATSGQEGDFQSLSASLGDVLAAESAEVGAGQCNMAPSPCLSSSSSAATSHATRRICLAPGCRRAIGSASNDLHTVYIVCRNGICTVNNRCSECAHWNTDLVTSASKYQHALQRK